MKKRILTLAIAVIIILGISALPAFAAASNLAANPTASTVYVNGTATAFEAYNIGGNNYFKLRDLAYALNGTAKQFEVGYDNATKAITLTTGRAYTPDGGEMARGDGTAKTASPTASRIYLDGRELNLTVYLIGGNNFFKLRDLMEAIDVFVGYDNATKAITLDTSKGYEPEGSATPTPTPTPTSGDSSLIGQWSSRRDTPIANTTRWIEFKSDGTFYYYLFDSGVPSNFIYGNHTFTRGGTWEFYGNFEVRGDRIYCTNVRDSYTAQTGGPDDDYRDRPREDINWYFVLDDVPYHTNTREYPWVNGSIWLNIEMYDPEATLSARWGCFQKPEA